jgi:type IV secretion system protein VirD4
MAIVWLLTSNLPVLDSLQQSLRQNSPNLMLIAGCAAGMGVIQLLGRNRKSKITTGRFGGGTEKRKARAIARRQRRRGDRKPKQPTQASVTVGSVHLPNLQQGVIVCGAPGSGKTYGIIDPAIRDAIRQGLPIVVYDFKGSQVEDHAAYASAHGYNVNIFAPGFPYSSVCNPLDFLRDPTDSLMASQLAEVIAKNTRRGSRNEDSFFADAGASLFEAVILLAKATDNADLFMANKILNLDGLPARIRQVATSKQYSIWTMESFAQLLASEDADKQLAGIIAFAQKSFKRFVAKDLISSFCGKTTIPLDLTGKQLLFLQVDIQKRDMVAPLLAAILHLLITRNFSKPRTEPLVVALDELPTLHLDDLPKWINEFRSYGFCPILGYQNFAQIQNTYGREMSKAIFAACATKVFFNPGDQETAEQFSRYLGESEVKLQTKSRSHGKQRSTSYSEQYQKRPLMTADQFLKLGQGECIVINPAYKSRGESSIPVRVKIKIPRKDEQIQKRSRAVWKKKLRPWMEQRHAKTWMNDRQLDDELQIRASNAERLFPKPDKPNSGKNGAEAAQSPVVTKKQSFEVI